MDFVKVFSLSIKMIMEFLPLKSFMSLITFAGLYILNYLFISGMKSISSWYFSIFNMFLN